MKGTAKVAFLAHRAAIEAELDAGWPVKAAYQKRREALGMSYAQFTRYVVSVIRGGRQPDPAAPALPQQPQSSSLPASEPTKEPAHARHQPARPRTFVYDGNPSPDDDALIFGHRKPER